MQQAPPPMMMQPPRGPPNMPPGPGMMPRPPGMNAPTGGFNANLMQGSNQPQMGNMPPNTMDINNGMANMALGAQPQAMKSNIMNQNVIPNGMNPMSNGPPNSTPSPASTPTPNSQMAPPSQTNTVNGQASTANSSPAPGNMRPPGPGMQPPGGGMPPGPGMQPPGGGMPPGPGMQPPGGGMSQGPGMQPPGAGMPPGPSMQPQAPGMRPPGQMMQPPGPGMRPGMPPPSMGMPPRPSAPGMQPPGPGMQPPGPGMQPPRPGMQPQRPGMQQPGSAGMPPSSMGMPPSGPGMHPQRPGMQPPGPGMPPNSMGMPPSNMGMPPRPGMPPPGPGMAPPGPGMAPPGPGMAPPGPGMAPPGQGMPPFNQPGGMAPPNSNMPNYPPGPMPPHTMPSSTMNQGPMTSQPRGPPPMGGYPGGAAPMPPGGPAPGVMQNRYPGSTPAAGTGFAQNQGRRLNPDDMPSPLQVMEEDRRLRGGEFVTAGKGELPPLVTTDFRVTDRGNASPRFLRSTMYSVPATPDMMKQISVPFGIVLTPMAEQKETEAPLYVGTSLANGPVRCNRCKAYMSPLMMFMDGGRRYQCQLCRQMNEVSPEYFCHMDSYGSRADKFHRPELSLGAYEFQATPEYCREKQMPKEPAFIFMIEITQMMMQRGIITLLCSEMKSLLEHLPIDVVGGEKLDKSKVKIGFITYDSQVHFYKLTGQAPEMCIVCDREEMFVPMPEGVLCSLDEAADNIDKLMDAIPLNFQDTKETSGALSCAIQSGMSALKASGRTGKLFVFHSSLPQAEGPSKLKNREDRKLLGTEKEKTVLQPQTTFYNEMAQDLVASGCAVDMYIFNDSYVDVATIGQIPRLTGGQVYKFTYFQISKDGKRLIEDLKLNLSRNIAFDAVMRVRTSTGVRPVDFMGHFWMSNTHDIELACIDSSKSIAIEIKHDDKLTEEDGVYVQAALLYTASSGQRRLRILNMAFKTCTQMADLYKSCDLDTLMNFFGKQSLQKFLDTSAKQVKENLVNKAAQILACYRKNCASPSSVGQLILPELMKLLPLYINCLNKCDALSGGQDLTCDDRSWHIHQVLTMPVEATVAYFYPRLISIGDADVEATEIPPPIRSSYEKLSHDGVYLLENGLFMFMWIGSSAPQSWMSDVFGFSSAHQLDPLLSELPELDNPTSRRVRGIIADIRTERKNYVRLFIVPQNGKHEVVMRNYLIEDKNVSGGPSYVDFLCFVHKEIRALLS